MYRLSTDGGIDAAQGQASGEASIGVVLRDPDGRFLGEISERIGLVKDHHVAEYRALVRGLQLVIERDIDQVRVFLDSALVVNQVNGDWKLKAKHLKELHSEVVGLMKKIDDIKICWIPREWNSEADSLASKALGR